MALVRDRIPSVEYWHSSEERVAQHFYISFCLFMSSVQDRFLSHQARKQSNLNWSATYGYYSLMHGARTLLFLTFGDFPMSHVWMASIWRSHSSGNDNENQSYQYGGFPFNWLEDFTSSLPDRVRPQRQGPVTPPKQECFNLVVDYLGDLTGMNLEADLRSFGDILSSAKELREDSNYESLLIAHEYHHERVSALFERLSRSMCTAANDSVDLVGKAFLGYLQNSDELEARRDEYSSFYVDYLNQRARHAISTKLAGDRELLDELREFFADHHLTSPEVDYSNYSQIQRWVAIRSFPGKGGLMGDFANKVLGFDHLVGKTDRLKERKKTD